MLMAGVNSLASLSPALDNNEASLLPDLADVRDVSVQVAAAVVRQAVEDGNAQDENTVKITKGEGELGLEDYIKVSNAATPRSSERSPSLMVIQSQMWDPVYRPLELVD